MIGNLNDFDSRIGIHTAVEFDIFTDEGMFSLGEC
jgi:hypothetical protein